MTKNKVLISMVGVALSLSATQRGSAAVVVEQRALSKPAVSLNEPSQEWLMLQKLQTLQSEIDRLNGRLELQEATINTQKKQISSLQEQTDRRIRTLEDALINSAQTDESTLDASDPSALPSDSLANQTTTAQTEAVAAATTPSPSASVAGGDQAMYMRAYEAFKTGGPEAGINQLSAFIKAYPNSPLVPKAHYWLGEFYLASATPNPQLAELNFTTLAKQYPDSEKAPTALYRIMVLEQGRGEATLSKQTAREILTRYPQSAEAPLAQTYLDQNPA